MIEGNQPCVCGHTKDFHSDVLSPYEVYNCKVCLMAWQYEWTSAPMICYQFRLDNLKYLEQLYEVNHK